MTPINHPLWFPFLQLSFSPEASLPQQQTWFFDRLFFVASQQQCHLESKHML